MGLSITQLGVAGALVLTNDAQHRYTLTFATRVTGDAGVRATHLPFWSSSVVEVLADIAVSVDVHCVPPRVSPGSDVRCAIEPRDRFGNVAEVEPPPSGVKNFFTVARLGNARDLVVHDTYVSFRAGAPPDGEASTSAGVVVTLDGRRVESTVSVG